MASSSCLPQMLAKPSQEAMEGLTKSTRFSQTQPKSSSQTIGGAQDLRESRASEVCVRVRVCMHVRVRVCVCTHMCVSVHVCV